MCWGVELLERGAEGVLEHELLGGHVRGLLEDGAEGVLVRELLERGGSAGA